MVAVNRRRDERRGRLPGRDRHIGILVLFVLCIQGVVTSSSTPFDSVKLGGATVGSSTTTTGKKRKRKRAKVPERPILPISETSNATSPTSPGPVKKRKRRRIKSEDGSTDRVIPETSNATLLVRETKRKRKKKKRRKASGEQVDRRTDDHHLQNTSREIETVSTDADSGETKPAFVQHIKLDAATNVTEETTQNSQKLSTPAANNRTEPVKNKKPTKTANNTTKAKKAKSKSEKSASSTGGREAACLRRIKREWRDAVKLGIAYDWLKMETKRAPKSSEISKHDYVRIGPWGKNLLRWHFSVQGPANSVYKNGVYHGVVLLPRDYPASPPRVQLLTPSGRFIPGHDICLSASNYHPESWTPRWTILSLVDALRLHMLTTANEIGGTRATTEQREKLALASRKWTLGKAVNHELMVKAGIFPEHTDSDQCVEKEVVSTEKEKVVRDGSEKPMDDRRATSSANENSSVGQEPLRRTGDGVVKKRHSRHGTLVTVILHAVVEVLTSPSKLVVLAILTVFVILNRH